MSSVIRSVFSASLLLVSLSGLLLAQQRGTLSGVVTDSVSGDVIPGATVLLYDAKGSDSSRVIRGAAANVYGFYSIPGVEPGDYLMVVRSIGYRQWSSEITVVPGGANRRDIGLVEEVSEGNVVEVIGTRETEPATRDIGRVELPVEYLQRLPMLGGESDILRTLQLLPGVQQVNEISSGLYVRGGSPDQNLTLLDEVVVYNPSHLAGFLSTFNSDAVRSIDLIKGAFPAKFGGRLSSVLDLTMREGTKEGFHGAGGVSLISSRLTVEGPISEKSTFMLSGRRFYLDLLQRLLINEEDAPDYYFYDLNGKVNYEIDSENKLYLSGYHGRDVILFDDNNEEVDVNWGNTTGNLRWAHILSPQAFAGLSLSWSSYEFNAGLSETDQQSQETQSFRANSSIKDVRLNGRVQLFPSEDHIVETGLEVTRHVSSVRAFEVYFGDSTFSLPDDLGLQNATSFESSLYLQDEWKATDRLSLNLGGRLTWFEKGNYFYAEPRASAVYRLKPDLSLTGSYAEARQPIHLVVRNGVSLPTDTWFPATETIRPGFSRQGSLGVMGAIDEGTWEWSVDGYYKSLDNIYEFADTASFSPLVQVEEQLVRGAGEAWGVELFLQKRIGDITGWIGYTLAETRRTFDELNRGKTFHPRYDRRHDAKIVLMYQLGESWDFGVTWVYGTGQAYTVPSGQYAQIDPDYPQDLSQYVYTQDRYTERNAFRLPAYHRMDVNFSHSFEWFELPWRLSLNVYNLYNRRNVFSWYLAEDYDQEAGEQRRMIRQLTLFPVIPTIGLSFEF